MKDTFRPTRSTSAKGYIIGFAASLLLTLSAYFLVQRHLANHHVSPRDGVMVVLLMFLALSQLAVQLVFFLHLGRESKPKWNLVIFLFAAMVVVILVAGSLWIMYNLNYHMAPVPSDQKIIHDEGAHL